MSEFHKRFGSGWMKSILRQKRMPERKDRRLTGVMRLAYGVAVSTSGVMR